MTNNQYFILGQIKGDMDSIKGYIQELKNVLGNPFIINQMERYTNRSQTRLAALINSNILNEDKE